MEKLRLRCFWGVVYTFLALIFGLNVSFTILFTHIIALPVSYIFSDKLRSFGLFLNSIAWPFQRHDHPKTYGLEGTRNMYIKFESKVDKCTINIGVWHALPRSLVEKHEFVINKGTKEEVNCLFDDELRSSEHPVFLYFHGVTESRAANYRVELYKFLQDLDGHVVAFDYRGYGDSTNVTPSKIGVVEDSLVVYSWVRSLVGPDKPVFVWGHSLGSAICQRAFSKLDIYCRCLLTLKEPLPPPTGIILEGPFKSTEDMSNEYIVAQIFNWFPPAQRVFTQTMRSSTYRLTPELYVGLLKQYPLLILHSKDDGIVPYTQGKILYEKHHEARKKTDAQVNFVAFENDGHFWICKNPRLPGIIQDFIRNNNTES